MRSLCAGHSSCNVIHLTSDTDPESSIFCQTYSAGHPVPNPSLSSSPTSHMYFATHICRSLNLGFPKGQNPSLRCRRWEVCPPCHSIVCLHSSTWRNTRSAGGGLLRVQPSPMLLYRVSPSNLPDWLLLCVLHV